MDVPEPLRSSKGLWRRLGRGAVRAASLEAGRRAGCSQRARGGGLGRGGCAVMGGCPAPLELLGSVEAGRLQPEAIRSVGRSVCVALPFRKLEEGQQILL